MAPSVATPPADFPTIQETNRDRVQDFETSPVHSAKADPVSTFSIDVDTASYSFVRSSLKQGMMPDPETVRVEEMINYFPYDWKGPNSSSVPFNSTVTVMPTPWNPNTRLMHVAIKGYDVIPAEKPKANLVFLIDISGSMDEADKLPLLRSAFRLLVGTLRPDDTVSIVTYAGDAGTVLEPTKVSERDKILNAIDTLTPGGSTAGEAGINEAYRLAEKSFVKDGINRVMLATDGDFNVGQTDDEQLKKLIEDEAQIGRLPVGVRLWTRQPQRPDDADHRPERQWHRRLHRHASGSREGTGAGRFVNHLPHCQGCEDPGRVQSFQGR